MRITVVLILMLALIAAACSAPQYVCPDGSVVGDPASCPQGTQEQTQPPAEPVQETQSTPEPTQEVEEAPVTDVRVQTEGPCTSTLEGHQVKKITLDVDNGPLMRTEDGFYLKVYPRTEEGDIVPVTGSIGVSVYTTHEVLDNPKGAPKRVLDADGELYRDSFYEKKENVEDDCSPAKIFIAFDKYDEQTLLRAGEGDPGAVMVKFKIGAQEFQTFYNPYEKGESVLP